MAREAQSRGLASLSFPEHTHIPVGSQDGPGGEIPHRYRRTLDPYVACAFVAASSHLAVGTAISLVAQHDAIALAKAVATLDHLSKGRFTLGVGLGYNRQEAEDHGFPAGRRAVVAEETVRLMRAIWSEDEAAFEGAFRRISPSWSWPKPVQPGGPPVLLGVSGTERNFERIVAWGDGWIPMGLGVMSEGFQESLRDLRTKWDDAGRTSHVQVCCFFQPDEPSVMARELERARELGIQRMEVYVEDRQRDALLPILDDVAAAVASLGGS